MSIKQSINLFLVTLLIGIGIPVSAVDTQINTVTSHTKQHSTLSIEEYKSKDATELANMVRNKQITSEELVELAFEVNALENPKTNALITTRKEDALKEAKEITDNGQPFLGVPIVVKGLGHTVAGGSNSSALSFNKDVISKNTGRLVKSLQDLGFIVIGQSNYPQLGLKNITDSALYGPTASAWDTNFHAGGSSGGSAAAVASGVVPVASGSDAGGSIRIPASWNGLVGFKPSRGIIKANPTTGQTVHFPLTKTMEDTQNLFTHLLNSNEGHDSPLLSTVKIGYTTTSPVGTPVSDDAKQAIMNSVNFLKSKGFDVQEITLPFDGEKLMQGYYVMATVSGSIANYQATQKLKRAMTIDDVELLTWALFQAGKLITNEDTKMATDYNEEVRQNMENLYQEFPLILTPTTASTAPNINDSLLKPEHAEQMKQIDNLKTKEERMKLIYDQWLPSLTYTPFTQFANLTGQPAISLPTYVSENNLPLGIQFNAAANNDQLLLDMGKLFEDNQQFKQINTDALTHTMNNPIHESTSSSENLDSSSTLEDNTNETMSSSSIEHTENTENQIDNSSSTTSIETSSQQSSDKATSSTLDERTETQTSNTALSDTTDKQPTLESSIIFSSSSANQSDYSQYKSSSEQSNKQNTAQSTESVKKDAEAPNKQSADSIKKSTLPKTSEENSHNLFIYGLITLSLLICLIRFQIKNQSIH